MSHNQPYLPEDDLLWRQLKTIPAFRAVLRAVESRFYFAVDLPGPTLDVGCGDGHFAQMTFDRPLDMGVDPWWNPLKKAYRSDAYNVVLQGMGDRMPFPDNHFASAFSNSVLEHIPDIQPVLNETSRVLQENGRFLITMPSQYFTQELGGALWLEKLSLDGMAGHYRRFFNRISRHEHTDSPEVWAARLAQAGFVVERWQYYFSAEALHALELGHAQGLPSALMHFLTGTWIVAPWNSSLAWTERWLRPFYQEEAAADRGAYLLIVARKQTNGPTPVYLPPACPFTVAELETAVAAKTPIPHEPVLPDLAPAEVLPEAVAETAVSPPSSSAEIQPAPQRQPRFDLIAASLLGLTLLLALIGQMSVSQPAVALSSGLRWFLLSFLAFFLLAWRVKAVKIRMPAWKRPSFRPETIPKRRWFYLLAFFLAFIAYRLAVSPAPWPAWLTLALWLGSMGLAFYALHVSSQYSGETRSEPVEDRWFRQAQPTQAQPTPPRFFEKIPKNTAPAPEQTAGNHPEMAGWLLAAAGLILFAAALAVRAAGLGSHPWILNGLESSLGLDVLAITRGLSTNPFGVGWLTNPTLPLFLTAVPVKLLGPSMVSLRVLSPVVGALTVTAVFYFGYRLWRLEVGMAAAILLAGSHFHVHFSRLGLTNVWDALLVTLALGTLALAWRSGRRATWLWGGLFTGLCAYTYTASRLLPLILGGLLLAAFLGSRSRWRRQAGHMAAAAALALVVALPIVLTYLGEPGLFMGRFNELGILSGQTGWLAQETARTGQSAWDIWQQQIGRALLAFNGSLDVSPAYRPERPLLSNGLAILFVLGVMIAIFRIREHKYLTALLWLLTPLFFGAVLLIESPSSHRLVLALPIICLLAAAALVELTQWALSFGRKTDEPGTVSDWLLPVVLAAALLLALNELLFYFGPYRQSHTFADRNTEIAHGVADYLNTLDSAATTAYFYGPPSMYIDFPTIPFLAASYQANVNLFNVMMGEETAVSPSPTTETLAFIVLPERVSELVDLQNRYTNGVQITIPGFHANPLFYVYEVNLAP